MAELFIPIVEQDKQHPKFKFLLDPSYQNEREILNAWWDEFVLKDGKTKTITEFQTTFHSMFWELYLNKVFLDSGYKIDETVKSPDFFIHFNEHKVSIEAVVANIAKDGDPEDKRTLQDAFGENNINEISDEAIVRLFNAIDYKNKKYFKNYVDNKDVESNPFTIAVADYGQINYGQTYIYAMLSLLYSAYYDPKDTTDLKILCNDNFNREYKFKEKHIKKSGGSLDIGLFQNKKYSHISAIIYSSTLSLGKLTSLSSDHFYPRFVLIDRDIPSLNQEELTFEKIRFSGSNPDETLNDGLFIFHNPFADKPLNDEFLNQKGVSHIRFNEDEDEPLTIECNGTFPLKRRRVGYSDQVDELIDNIENFNFFQVPK